MMEETRDGREVERCGPDKVFGGSKSQGGVSCRQSSIAQRSTYFYLLLLRMHYCLRSAG